MSFDLQVHSLSLKNAQIFHSAREQKVALLGEICCIETQVLVISLPCTSFYMPISCVIYLKQLYDIMVSSKSRDDQ